MINGNMTMEWVIIEIFAVLIENLAEVYFLNSRYVSKNETLKPQITICYAMSVLGILAFFYRFPVGIYEGAGAILLLFFLIYAKRGYIWQKIAGVIILTALEFATSLLGAALASILADVDITNTLLYQDTSRLLAIVLIKTIQVVVLYALAKKHTGTHILKKKTTIMISLAIMIVFICNLLIFSSIHDFDYTLNRTLTWLALGLLSIIVVVFLLYEMFVREETDNLGLSIKLQRMEMESGFYNEMGALHTDIRTWRHEYKNNMIALHTLIEHNENDKALEFIDSMSLSPSRDSDTLQTGNHVLDAVVSSKLWYARSQEIDVSIQAVYPEEYHIDNIDLCAIVGNLLDNAIEACLRMGGDSPNRFISFSLLVKGKNLTISISNSYEGILKKDGKRFITDKDQNYHGIGIQYVDSIVDKYQGHVLREYADGIFETHVMVPLISALDEKK